MRVSHSPGPLLVAGIAAAAVVTALTVTPAYAQFDPTPPPNCEQGSETDRECNQEETSEGNGNGGGQGGSCAFMGVSVNCYEPGYGTWVGTPSPLRIAPASPVRSAAAAPSLAGCYAQPSGAPWGGQPPPEDVDPDEEGFWAELSCFGDVPVMPPPSWAAAVWLPGAPAGPDPEELARRALASITLLPPQFTLAPPASGSVPLGMPVWLAVEETAASWGPIGSGPVCDQGLCVTVTAVAEQVNWNLGDGGELTCTRGQNRPWRAGMNFLNPGDACHHFYPQPSRGEPGGSFAATAAVTWRAEWEGGGQSGVFVDITDVCGASSTDPCVSTVDITVEEIQVVGAR